MYNIAKRVSRRHSVSVITFGNSSASPEWREGFWVRRYEAANIWWGSGYYPVSSGFVKALIRSEADITHAHAYAFFQTDAAARLKLLKRRRLVVTTHYDWASSASIGISVLRWLYNSFIGSTSLRAADRIIALTHWEKDFLERSFRIDPSKVCVIPNGVNLEEFRSLPEPSDLMERLALHDGPVVLTVGRIQAKKGLGVLLRAVPEVLRSLPDVKFVIAGEDWGYKNQAQELCKALGISEKVVFTGRMNRTELLMAYALADVLVMPSFGEATGLVLLEAMAARRPVVASALDTVLEIISDGRSGLLFPPGDHSRLARAVTHVLENDQLRQALVANAYERLIREYDWARVSSRLEDLYRSI